MDRISKWKCGDCELFGSIVRAGSRCYLGSLVVADDRICADFVLAIPEADATFCEACGGNGVITDKPDFAYCCYDHKCEDCDGKGYIE